MKCPVCEAAMDSMACVCGYDESRNYERYPTLEPLPMGAQSAAGARLQRKNLIRCGGCGHHGFSLDHQAGMLCCLRCGRALTEEELKPLHSAMGWEQAPTRVKKAEAPMPGFQEKDPRSLLNVLGKIQQQRAAEPTVDPRRIVAVAGGRHHTVALYADGTVGAIGGNSYGQCNVSEWKDIVAISARWYRTTGVKKDGTVLVAGSEYGERSKAVSAWKDIKEVADGTFHTVGRTGHGTVVSLGDKSRGKRDLADWRGLRAIAVSNHFTVGLKVDGTVVTAGWGRFAQITFGGWRDITAVATSDSCTVGLRKDGTVAFAGSNCRGIDKWKDIANLKAGSEHIVGLKKDGTAVAVGFNSRKQCEVGTWRDLEAVAAGDHHTIGLKKDGTLVATGDNKNGQCDVEKLYRI